MLGQQLAVLCCAFQGQSAPRLGWAVVVAHARANAGQGFRLLFLSQRLYYGPEFLPNFGCYTILLCSWSAVFGLRYHHVVQLGKKNLLVEV